MNYADSLELTDDPSQIESPHREFPLVSVIVATHKRAALLRRALDSVLAQTFKDIEVWIIHDGPPDDETVEVYKGYAPLFEAAGLDFYPLSTDEHSGYYCTPRNLATENSRGVYIANLDDDNEWLPDTLASLVAAMEEGEMWPDLVYGRREYVLDPDAPAEIAGRPASEFAGPSPLVEWNDEAMLRLAGNMPALNFIDSSDFLVSKGALYRLGFQAGHIWDERRRRFGDFYLVSDGLLIGDWRFKPLDKIVQRYHLHATNVSLTRPVQEAPTEILL